MKNGKMSRAMGYIDDELILSAMNVSDAMGKDTERKKNMKKNTMWKKWVAVAAAFVIMLSVGIVAVGMSNAPSGATVALDINPSIELEIDKNEKITEVKTLNEDAVTVIGTMELVGTKLDVGMNAIIGSMLTNGYLSTDQNSILISIDSKNSKQAEALKTKISSEVTTLLGNNNIEASVITQNFKDNSEVARLAEENNISYAKAALISKIVKAGMLDANGVPYTSAVLSKLNVNELKLILESKAFSVDGVQSGGTASSGLYISISEALMIAMTDAEVIAVSAVTHEIELDFDIGVFSLVYEVELVVANEIEYEYEIHAKTGEILEKQVKPYDSEDDGYGITVPEGSISREEALQISYTDAGVSADNVRRPEIEIEKEGKNYYYEIDFKSGGREYEYKINAKTGKIVERESERDD